MNGKFNVWALGLTSGLMFGLGLFFITWWIMIFEGTVGDPIWIGRIYRGYSVTPLGSIIGLIWGFCDWFVGGVIFGWLYNLIAGTKTKPAA
jgi:hypothetical protein